jgi:hypothetical protein
MFATAPHDPVKFFPIIVMLVGSLQWLGESVVAEPAKKTWTLQTPHHFSSTISVWQAPLQ